MALKVSHNHDLHHSARVSPHLCNCLSQVIARIEAEQVAIESPDLTAAVIRLPERLIFMASVYVELFRDTSSPPQS
jgi:hypothetical protein